MVSLESLDSNLNFDVVIMKSIVILERAIARQPSAAEDLAIERMGDPAFDWLRIELRDYARPPSQKIRALQLMARLSRQFCVDRKGDLVDEAVALIKDDASSVELRSAAMRIAIVCVGVAARLRDAARYFSGRDSIEVRRLVTRTVRESRDQIFSDDVAKLVSKFLAQEGLEEP